MPITTETTRMATAMMVGAMASPIVTRRRNVSITPVSISSGIQTNNVSKEAREKKIARPTVHGAFCIFGENGPVVKTDPIPITS
ncbi:MAG TPA: hypothetical protein EYQ26_10210 [Rhodospirillales bacterium]|nr:hypothetical protein [Rhodospirillales bacterium]